MVEAIREYTTIGKGGLFAETLMREGRIHLLEKIPAHFGSIIATTSKPEENKRLEVDELRKLLKNESLTFLIGLGRRGLPKEIIKKSKYHLDITWRGVSLETCSAMGVIASTLYWLSR